MVLAKEKESSMQVEEYNLRTGLRILESHFAKECWAEPVMDKIGRRGTSFLWVFGRPYILGRCEPEGLIDS